MQRSDKSKLVDEIFESSQKKLTLSKEASRKNLSDGMKYHLANQIPIRKCIYAAWSDQYCNLMKEARKLVKEGHLTVDDDDMVILAKLQTGTKAVWQGKSVVLDSPRRNSGNPDKKFIVYHSTGKKDKEGNWIAKKIEWGSPDLNIKNSDDKARKSFLARHQCHLKKDQSTPGWWACNIHRFAKELGLESDKPW